jgi:hypothetical protein
LPRFAPAGSSPKRLTNPIVKGVNLAVAGCV